MMRKLGSGGTELLRVGHRGHSHLYFHIMSPIFSCTFRRRIHRKVLIKATAPDYSFGWCALVFFLAGILWPFVVLKGWTMTLRPSICIRCSLRHQYSRLFHASAVSSRSGTRIIRRPARVTQGGPGKWLTSNHEAYDKSTRKDWFKTRQVVVPESPAAQRDAVLDHLTLWSDRLGVQQFVRTLGLRPEDARHALLQFKDVMYKELKGDWKKSWAWKALKREMEQNMELAMDRALMKRFIQVMPTLDPTAYGHFVALKGALVLPHPAEWHPMARQVHRRIFMHVGPTNSGKTYHALRALAGARYGCYAGPLRLLATEIFSRFNKGDIAPLAADPTIKHPRVCNLVTGEDIKIIDEEAGLMSCTVEMIPLTQKFDVVVIDEIQMIAHPDRGNGWTQALLGLNAEEIHLCGEESAVELVQELVRPTGDEVIVNRYERLTPLQMAPESMKGELKGVRPGDCIVAFSRNQIFAIKALVEEKTGLRCAVAYGKLPPEVRVEQANKFNEGGNEYPVLVASDAIGMGLNL
jgi:Helicase conserved C-terminal domain